jgi:hypothetical protein
LDGRTTAEFATDIKRMHIAEVEIAIRLAVDEYLKSGIWQLIAPSGTDFTGELKRNNSEVSISPDYLIGDRLVEITHSKSFCKTYFHEKVKKVDFCIENDCDIVFVNGFGTKHPTYIRLSGKALKQTTKTAKQKYGLVTLPFCNGRSVAKPCYRYLCSWFSGKHKGLPSWSILPPLDKKMLPKEYLMLLDCVK